MCGIFCDISKYPFWHIWISKNQQILGHFTANPRVFILSRNKLNNSDYSDVFYINYPKNCENN